MLLSVKNLMKYSINAKDGNIGQVYSFLFHEDMWVIRYLVVDTSKWLPGRKVLIIPSEIGAPDEDNKTLGVNLTKEKIKDSPDIDTEKPVSRREEESLYKYYNWAPYWGAGYGPILTPYEPVVPGVSEKYQSEVSESEDERKQQSHLRSAREILGYSISALDGEVGFVEDFLIDNEKWNINYIILDTHKWLPGRKIVLPVEWISEITWHEKEVGLDVKKDTVKGSADYDPDKKIGSDYEAHIHSHYDQ